MLALTASIAHTNPRHPEQFIVYSSLHVSTTTVQMRDLAKWQLLPSANVVCEGYVFTPVCVSVNRGACVGCGWGHAWGHACIAGGACMVGVCMAKGGHAWYARP